MYRMMAGYAPGSSGHAAKHGCRPYLVVTITSCSRIALPSCAEQLARTGQQHVVDPDELHEVLAHALARCANPCAGILHRGLHAAVRRVARVTERLREVEQAKAQIVHAGDRSEIARELHAAPALDHEADRDAG